MIRSRRFIPEVPVASLVPHPDNARRGDVDAIAESVRANGFYGAIIVRDTPEDDPSEPSVVLAGWHRVLVAREGGLLHLPAVLVECDDETALRIVLVDNRSSDLSLYDDQALSALLSEMPSLVGTGYTDDDLAELLTRARYVSPDGSTTAAPSPVALRSMVLNYPNDEFRVVMRNLIEVQELIGLTSTADTVRWLAGVRRD